MRKLKQIMVRNETTARTTKLELTPDEMKAALVKDQQQRVNAASEAIKATCEKYKVQLVPQCMLTNGNVQMSLSIQPTE